MVDEWTLHRGTLPRRIHRNNSHASPSMAFDGERLFASFYTDDSIVVTALSPDGREKWETRVCAFQPSSFEFGYGASPIVEDDLVIVAAEYDGQDSGIYALDRSTGRQVWKIPRPQNLNFASPIIATIAGQRQLMIAGADQFASYDPRTGKELWATNTTTEAICGTVVWDERYAMVSGGNPVSGTWCVSADGRERLIWEKPVMCYEQSLLAIKNYVFAVSDAGVMYCWRTHDGKRMWRERLLSGGISASPLLVDDHLVVASETGDVFVVKASPDRFSLRYQANAGDSIFASPVAIGDRLFLRVGVSEAQGRQEYVIAVGK
jgi:outer membrane protein assembly factor BamB